MRREGFVLVTTIILILVLTVIAGVASYVVRKEVRIDKGMLNSVKAKNAAESGVELALMKIKNKEIPSNCTEDNPNCTFSGSLDDERYTVKIVQLEDKLYKIISKGFSKEAEKTIIVKVAIGKKRVGSEFYPFAARGEFDISQFSGQAEDAPVIAGSIPNKDYLKSVGFGPLEEKNDLNLVQVSDLDMKRVFSPDGVTPIDLYVQNLVDSYEVKYPKPEKPAEPKKPNIPPPDISILNYPDFPEKFPEATDLIGKGCDYGALTEKNYYMSEGNYTDNNGDGVIVVCAKDVFVRGKLNIDSELRIVATRDIFLGDYSASALLNVKRLVLFAKEDLFLNKNSQIIADDVEIFTGRSAFMNTNSIVSAQRAKFFVGEDLFFSPDFHLNVDDIEAYVRGKVFGPKTNEKLYVNAENFLVYAEKDVFLGNYSDNRYNISKKLEIISEEGDCYLSGSTDSSSKAYVGELIVKCGKNFWWKGGYADFGNATIVANGTVDLLGEPYSGFENVSPQVKVAGALKIKSGSDLRLGGIIADQIYINSNGVVYLGKDIENKFFYVYSLQELRPLDDSSVVLYTGSLKASVKDVINVSFEGDSTGDFEFYIAGNFLSQGSVLFRNYNSGVFYAEGIKEYDGTLKFYNIGNLTLRIKDMYANPYAVYRGTKTTGIYIGNINNGLFYSLGKFYICADENGQFGNIVIYTGSDCWIGDYNRKVVNSKFENLKIYSEGNIYFRVKHVEDGIYYCKKTFSLGGDTWWFGIYNTHLEGKNFVIYSDGNVYFNRFAGASLSGDFLIDVGSGRIYDESVASNSFSAANIIWMVNTLSSTWYSDISLSSKNIVSLYSPNGTMSFGAEGILYINAPNVLIYFPEGRVGPYSGTLEVRDAHHVYIWAKKMTTGYRTDIFSDETSIYVDQGISPLATSWSLDKIYIYPRSDSDYVNFIAYVGSDFYPKFFSLGEFGTRKVDLRHLIFLTPSKVKGTLNIQIEWPYYKGDIILWADSGIDDLNLDLHSYVGVWGYPSDMGTPEVTGSIISSLGDVKIKEFKYSTTTSGWSGGWWGWITTTKTFKLKGLTQDDIEKFCNSSDEALNIKNFYCEVGKHLTGTTSTSEETFIVESWKEL